MNNILVTGGSGLVGQAIKNIIKDENYIFTHSKEADLSDFNSCYNLFDKYKPIKVIHLAAYVGGLFKNMNEKDTMFEKNLLINFNVVKCSHIFKVKKLIGCLSTCIFPDNISYPINEKMLFNGEPHNSNYGYAHAKRILEIQCKIYREQYNDNFMCVIPTNIYGPNDNFNLEDSHVIPALIHKCYLSKLKNEDFIVYGTGKPLRQFIYSLDLAKLIIEILNSDFNESIILSPDESSEISIKEIAELIAKEFDYADRLVFNTKKSDGQFKKTADNSLLKKHFNNFKFKPLKEGLKETITWFKINYNTIRK